MRTLIIHPKDPSTNFLKPIYAPIQDKTVITGGVSKYKLRELIKNHDRIMMLGHGSPYGLLSIGEFPNAGSYIIDSSFSELLSAKDENIFIWCFANKFVERHGLYGFFSAMFISEPAEALSWGYFISKPKLIEQSNDVFASIVAKFINEPLELMFRNVIQEYTALSKTNPIAQFNLERLYLNSNHKKNGSNHICKELPELP